VRNMGLGLLVGLILLIPVAAKAVNGVRGANTTDGCMTTLYETAQPGQDIICNTYQITVCNSGGAQVLKGPDHFCSWVCIGTTVGPAWPPCTGE
jgi:hypothetical protein